MISQCPRMGKKKKPRPTPESLGLPCVGVETHAHIDMEHFDEDREEVLARAKNAGVAQLGNVFLGPANYTANKGMFDAHPQVFFLLGVHPHDAAGCDADALAGMESAFKSDPRLKAFGEMGLDYYWDHSPRDVQRRVFREQLQLCKELDVPAVIHSRDADEDILRILHDAGFKDRPLLWHCFGRDKEFAKLVLANGWHISIPGTVSFKKSMDLKDSVTMIPMDRMVLETDCPYLTPEPYRGKRNEPAYLAFTAQAVATERAMDIVDVWTKCAENAQRFFDL